MLLQVVHLDLTQKTRLFSGLLAYFGVFFFFKILFWTEYLGIVPPSFIISRREFMQKERKKKSQTFKSVNGNGKKRGKSTFLFFFLPFCHVCVLILFLLLARRKFPSYMFHL